MTVIGSAYVNIRAITDKLESDIRKTIESITDTVTIKVDADVSQATAKLNELSDRVVEQTIHVDADVDSAQASLDDIANRSLGDQTIHVDVDTTAANAGLADIANTSYLQDQTIHVDVDVDTLLARRSYDSMVDDMNNQSPRIIPRVNGILARAQMALLTRVRTAQIVVKTNEASLARAGTVIAALSGGRPLWDKIETTFEKLKNLDKAVPHISKVSLAIGGVSSVLLSSIGGLSTFGASLISIVNMAGILAPGMLTGFIVGIGTLMVALKDFKNQLPGVVEQYKTLQNTVNNNFWANARESIRDMATTLFPQMEAGVASVSGSLGEWSASLADALKVGLGNGVLRFMFENLAKSIDIAKGANKPLVDSFISLGRIGSEMLPRLASWFVEVSTKFGDFINKADSNGDLQRWAEEGIDNLKTLGSAIGDLAGIFGNITEAAKLAGSDGLQTFADTMKKLNDLTGSNEFIKNMAEIFRGANAATSDIGDGLMVVVKALGSAAPAISSILQSSGHAIEMLAGGLGKIIENPAFQGGMVAMFDGIESGVSKLAPALEGLAPKMGEIGKVIGTFADIMGGVFAQAIQLLMPALTSIGKVAEPLIRIIGGGLVSAMKLLQPVFDELVPVIEELGPPLQELATKLVELLLPAIEALVPVLKIAVDNIGVALKFIIESATNVVDLISALFKGDFMAVFGLLGKQIADALFFIADYFDNLFGTDIRGFLTDFGANWVTFWGDVAKNWTAFWDGLGKGVSDFFGGIGKWFGEAGANVEKFVSDAGKGIGDFFGGIGGMFGDGANAVGSFFTDMGNGVQIGIASIGQFFTDAGTNITNIWNSIWSGLASFLAPVFSTIGTVVQNGIDTVMTIINAIGDTLHTVFGAAWDSVTALFSAAWESIQTIVATGLSVIIAFFTGNFDQIPELVNSMFVKVSGFFMGAFETISGIVSTAWQTISDIWNNAINAIVAFGQNTWNAYVAFMLGIFTGLLDWWNGMWAGFGSFVTGLWNSIVAMGQAVWQGLINFLMSLVINLIAGWNSMWAGFRGFITGLWNGIINAGRAIWQGLVNFLVNLIINCVANIKSTWNSITSFLSGLWNNIVTGAKTAWDGLISWIKGIPDKIKTGLGDLGSMLSNAGKAIMDGFKAGLEGAWKGVQDFVGGIGQWIKDHKGPISYDRTLLVPAGNAIMDGLNEGLEKRMPHLKKVVKGVTDTVLGDTKKHLGIHSPSREFQKIGTWVTVGLANGIAGGRASTVKTMLNLAQRITDAATQHFKNASSKAVIKAGQAGIEIQQGRVLDRVADQVRAQANRLAGLADSRVKLAARLKSAQSSVDKILGTRNKEAEKVAGNLRGEFKLSNMVGMDAKSMVAGANAIATRIKAFGVKITALRNLGLSSTLISEVAGLGSEDGTIVADQLIKGGKTGVAGLNEAYKSIDASAKSTGLAVANGMFGAGIQAAQGIADGIRKNIRAVDAAAKAISDRLLSQVKKTLGIRSPSRVMRDEVGMQIGAGLAQGIRNSMKLVSAATDDLMTAATPDASSLNLTPTVGSPVLNSGAVLGSNTTAYQSTYATPLATAAAGAGVNVIVNPSAGMDEVAVGRAAVRELNWQLISA